MNEEQNQKSKIKYRSRNKEMKFKRRQARKCLTNENECRNRERFLKLARVLAHSCCCCECSDAMSAWARLSALISPVLLPLLLTVLCCCPPCPPFQRSRSRAASRNHCLILLELMNSLRRPGAIWVSSSMYLTPASQPGPKRQLPISARSPIKLIMAPSLGPEPREEEDDDDNDDVEEANRCCSCSFSRSRRACMANNAKIKSLSNNSFSPEPTKLPPPIKAFEAAKAEVPDTLRPPRVSPSRSA